ncbi:hypothetical protein [Gimesia chilikensis]|uniref:hypothetical protein n=1 Tax=Gimesia chilikensis TaxID=2605989 RepID=UPI00119DCD34|nr:hypothetical protein [Gimesia chilikensis]
MMEEFLYLKKSRRFWGWTVCLSLISSILSPFLSINAVLNIITSISQRWEETDQQQPFEFIVEILNNSLAALSAGATAMLVSLAIFLISLILYLKRGKAMLALTERALTILESTPEHAEVPSTD